jgi:hypothetical protein
VKDFPISFSPLAIEDTEQAFHYYEQQQSGLGKQFTAQLQLSLNAIKRNPFFASVRYDDIRCARVKKFPYLVHYHIDEAGALVTIIAVYSTHREPFG